MIRKSPYNNNNCSLGLKFTKDARTAWGNIIGSLTSSLEVSILLPSYIGRNDKEGSGVFDPVLDYNTEFEFYKLGESLEVDVDDFKAKIFSGNINVALVVHYFGFCRTDMGEIKRFCNENDIILVEDCAHAFHLGVESQLIGNYGDFSFYSVHKYLATNSGGVLKVNNETHPLDKIECDKKIELSDLEIYSNSDLNEISNIRRMNFKLYAKLLSTCHDIEVMYELTSMDMPQTFPIRVKIGLREKLYYFLLEKGMPTIALYYRLIEEIDLEKYPLSCDISYEILNLPVHQDISEEDVVKLCHEVIEFFEERVGL